MNVLDNYEILSIIGEGTFGVVRLGKVKSTGEKVAIKILEKKKMTSQDDQERVEREIEILNKINHINVIKIIKIIKNPERIYIIMEYCENGELFNHIVEKESLDEEEAAYYYYQLINGLEYLHNYGVVHRDLKPENLLLSKNNILKIIDFGLSNYYNEIDLLSTPCGSPCYASPEMVSGNKYDGFLIDIWSSGIILFAMLCGYLPFEDQDNEVLFNKIFECKVEFPNDISKDAINLMKKIMVSNPQKRITLKEIKKHRFYLKGKRKFRELLPNLVKEVEKSSNEKIEYKIEQEKIKQIIKEKDEKEKNENKKVDDSKEIKDLDSNKNNVNINVENINENKDKKTSKENKIENIIEEKKEGKQNSNKIKDLIKENKIELNDFIQNIKDKNINGNKCSNKDEININKLNKNFYTKNKNNSKKEHDNNIGIQNNKEKELLINDNKFDLNLNELNKNDKLNKDSVNELKNSNYNLNKNKGITEQKLERKLNNKIKIINHKNNNDNLYSNIQNQNFKDSINNNSKKSPIRQINMLNEKVNEKPNINKINEDDIENKIENQDINKHNALSEKIHINHDFDFIKNKYITKTQKTDKKSINKNFYLSIEDSSNNENQINLNSVNIPSNLKNKINIEKKSLNYKVNESVKEKILPKLVEPLTIIKNDNIKYRNSGYEQSWASYTVNNRLVNSNYISRLTEKENKYYHKINKMNSRKINNNNFLKSESQNVKKKNISNISKSNQNSNTYNQKIPKSDNKMNSFIRENDLYSNLFNIDDKTISDSNKIIQNKNMNQSMKNRKINYAKNTFTHKINNENIINYSKRNASVQFNSQNIFEKNDVNLNNTSQRNKIIKINLQNDKIRENSNKSFNHNNISKSYLNNKINQYQHSNTLSSNNEDLSDDINYRRKFNTEINDSINLDKESQYIKISDNKKEYMKNYINEKSISNYNLLKNNSMFNQKLNINMKLNSPKNNMTNEDFVNINFNETRKKYNITSKNNNMKDRKLMKYTSNNIFNQNINLGANFSNSIENYRTKIYPQLFTINNLSSIDNLHTINQEINNMKYSQITSKKNNSTFNKYLFDNKTNSNRNNKYYPINEIKNLNGIKYLENDLIRKGFVLNTTNDNNMNKDNDYLNTNNNIYYTKIKPNLKYLSKYNLNKILNTNNEINNSQLNKTQNNSKNVYLNKKLDFIEIDINDNSLGSAFLYGNHKIKNNKIFQQKKEKNKRNKMLFHKKNNRNIVQNNKNNNKVINYINNDIDRYNSINVINIKNNHIMNSNLNKKRKIENIKYTNNHTEDSLIKLAKSNDKRQRTLENESLNSKNIHQKIRQRGEPLSFLLPKELNNEIYEHYFINNPNLYNLSKSLINDTISKNINRSKKSYINKNRITMNLNNNFNYIFNNNNYFKNN